MRVLAIRSVLRFQFTTYSSITRPNSNLALAYLNSTSSDSSSDEQSNHLLVGWDPHAVGELLYRLRRDPEESLSLFYRLKGQGFRHTIETYVRIISIVCEHGMGRKLETLLSEIMRIGEVEPGLRITDLIEALFERHEGEESMLVQVLGQLVKAYAALGMYEEAVDVLFQTRRGFVPPVKSCNFLLNQLIGCGRVDMAVSVYEQLKRLGFAPNVYTYNILMKAYYKKALPDEAFEFFNEMEKAGVDPNEYTYTTYIEGLCSQGKADLGYEVLKSWRKLKVPFDNFAYEVVIRGFCGEMKLDRAKDVLHDIESQGLTPDIRCFGSLIDAYYKSGEFQKVLLLHNSMVVKGVKTNCVVITPVLQSLCSMGKASEAVEYAEHFKESGVYLDRKSYNVMVDALCKIGKMDEAKELFNQMESTRVVPDVIHYSTLIKGYCMAGKLYEALRIFDEMKGKGLKPDVITYNILVGASSRRGLAVEAKMLFQLMLAQGLEPNAVTYKEMIEGLCTSGKVKEAEAVFDGVEPKSLLIYSAMFNGYCEAKCVSVALKFFVKLSKHGVLLNKKCCFKLFSNLLNEGEIDKALFLLETSSPCIKMCSKLISSFCQAGDVGTARVIFEKWFERGLEPDVVMYTIMINGYCKVNRMIEADELFKNMRLRGINPDIITYTVMIDGLLNSYLDKTHPHSHPSDAQGKELLKGVLDLCGEIKDKNISPDVACYTSVISTHCRLHNLHYALKLFEKMKRGLKPDNMTYTALLSGCCRSGDVEGFVALTDDMSKNGVHPDDITMSVLEHAIKKFQCEG